MEEIVKQARLVWRLLRDGRVPLYLKLIPLATFGYIVFLIDVIPDIPLIGLGQLDDVAALLLGWKLFVSLCPRDVVEEHLAALERAARPSISARTPLLGEGNKEGRPGSSEK